MAIHSECTNCRTKFKAKDELAGKRVKCPKCSQPVRIPEIGVVTELSGSTQKRQMKQATSSSVKGGYSTGATHNRLLNLLDEAGVEAVPHGPICENCGCEMGPTAIVCVECGYNAATGQKLETTVYRDDNSALVDVGITDAEKVMAKAEREIEDMPITAIGQDFGDGADSFVIALGSAVVFLILAGIGVGIIFLMDQITQYVNSSYISFLAAIAIGVCMATWITIVAFLTKPVQGVICLVTAGLYCVVYGFMQGRALLVPTIILLASFLIGLISYFFAFAPPDYS